MLKKIGCFLFGMMLLMGMAACGGQEETSSTVESQAAVSTLEEESSQPVLRPEPRTMEAPPVEEGDTAVADGQETVLELSQQESGAEAGYEPRVTLYADGTFEMFASFYDGAATISGNYTQEGDGYVLTPTESTAQGVMGSDVGEMTFSPEEQGYAYSGDQLGLTYDGAVFETVAG